MVDFAGTEGLRIDVQTHFFLAHSAWIARICYILLAPRVPDDADATLHSFQDEGSPHKKRTEGGTKRKYLGMNTDGLTGRQAGHSTSTITFALSDQVSSQFLRGSSPLISRNDIIFNTFKSSVCLF
jgi:hypothetical protein